MSALPAQRSDVYFNAVHDNTAVWTSSQTRFEELQQRQELRMMVLGFFVFVVLLFGTSGLGARHMTTSTNSLHYCRTNIKKHNLENTALVSHIIKNKSIPRGEQGVPYNDIGLQRSYSSIPQRSSKVDTATQRTIGQGELTLCLSHIANA